MPNSSDFSNLKNRKLYIIPVDELVPDPDQPRKYFEEKSIEGLAKSIKSHDVLQPILFTVKPDSSELIIISGERRWRASKLANKKNIPGIFIKDSNEFIALVENMVRVNLTPIERAEAIHRLIEKYDYTHEDVADRLSKSRSNISNVLSLIRLPDEIKDECRSSNQYPLRELLVIARKATPKGMKTSFAKLKDKLGKDTTKNKSKRQRVGVNLKSSASETEDVNMKRMVTLCEELSPLVKNFSGALGDDETKVLKRLARELKKLLNAQTEE